MIQTFDHRLLTSFMLYLDHEICQNLSGFTTITGQFYNIGTKYPYKVYASPYRGLIADSSISGATVLTGIYSGTTTFGTGDNVKIDYLNGKLLFPTGVSLTPTGTYSIKDFPVEPCPSYEIKVLFDTKYVPRPKANSTYSGLAENESVYPIIFVKYHAGENEPFQLGGVDETQPFITVFTISDSEFKLMAIDGLLRDKTHEHFTLLKSSEIPYNEYGCLKSGYNYDNVIASHPSTDLIYMSEIKVSEFPDKLNTEIGKNIWASITDIYIKYVK
jgi:hypothetical protein